MIVVDDNFIINDNNIHVNDDDVMNKTEHEPQRKKTKPVVIAKAFTPAAKVQEEIQVTLVNGLRASAGELGEPLNAAIEKLPADLKQGLLQRLNGQ